MQLYYLYVYVVDDDLKIDDDIKYKRWTEHGCSLGGGRIKQVNLNLHV